MKISAAAGREKPRPGVADGSCELHAMRCKALRVWTEDVMVCACRGSWSALVWFLWVLAHVAKETRHNHRGSRSLQKAYQSARV